MRDSILDSEREAIIKIRQSRLEVSAYKLARRIRSGEFDTLNTTARYRSFLSTYSVIRRYDAKQGKPAKKGKLVTA